MTGAFKDAVDAELMAALNKIAESIERELAGLPPIPVSQSVPIEYVKFECIEAHVRAMQDVSGTFPVSVGDIIEIRKSEVDAGNLDWIIDSSKFKRL